MKLALLTTDTPHHTFYVWKLAERFPIHTVFLESNTVIPPFETHHPFESRRDEYEREILLKGCPAGIDGLTRTMTVASVNGGDSLAELKAIAPDVVLVFGTGKLLAPVIQMPSRMCLNLHGGNPEHYRGLDSHLWAIYHRDFSNLITTLHYVDAGLDTGAIAVQSEITLQRNTELFQLRALNTQVCLDLTLLALSRLQRNEPLPRRSQVGRGRYYSFMPAVLKEDCVKKFEAYVVKL
jgi:methionyl-tRNA formyltransferase